MMDDGEDDTVSGYLVCKKSNDLNYVLLSSIDGKNINYESRIIFLNNNIYRVNFIVSERFSNESLTAAFTDKLQAAYNIYMGENNIPKSNIITTFTNVDNIGKMVISMNGGAFGSKTAPLVMLKGVDPGAGSEAVKKYYEENGFSCSVEEQDMVLSD